VLISASVVFMPKYKVYAKVFEVYMFSPLVDAVVPMNSPTCLPFMSELTIRIQPKLVESLASVIIGEA